MKLSESIVWGLGLYRILFLFIFIILSFCAEEKVENTATEVPGSPVKNKLQETANVVADPPVEQEAPEPEKNESKEPSFSISWDESDEFIYEGEVVLAGADGITIVKREWDMGVYLYYPDLNKAFIGYMSAKSNQDYIYRLALGADREILLITVEDMRKTITPTTVLVAAVDLADRSVLWYNNLDEVIEDEMQSFNVTSTFVSASADRILLDFIYSESGGGENQLNSKAVLLDEQGQLIANTKLWRIAAADFYDELQRIVITPAWGKTKIHMSTVDGSIIQEEPYDALADTHD